MVGTQAKVATFTQKGKILLLETQCVVPKYLDQHQLLESLIPIERGLLDIQATYQKFNMTMNLHHHRIGQLLPNSHVSKVISKTILGHMGFLLNGVQTQRREVRDFLVSLGNDIHPPRIKRGLFDLGGNIARFALGLATVQDVSENSGRILNIQELYSDLADGLQVHTEVLNVSLIHIAALQKKQNQILEGLQDLHSGIIKLSQIVEVQLGDVLHFQMVSASLTYVSSGLSQLFDLFQEFQIGLDHFKTGKLSAHLVTPETLISIVEQIIALNLYPLFPPTKEYISMYFNTIKVVALEDPFEYLLLIPLKAGKDAIFDLFEIEQIPVPISPKLAIQVQDLSNYFAINKQLSTHFTLPNLNGCTQIQDLYLCDQRLPLQMDASTCEAQLFLKDSKLSLCKKFVSKSKQSPTFVFTKQGWYYSASLPTTIVVSCDNRRSVKAVIPSGAGKLEFQSSCTVRSKNQILPPHTSVQGTSLNLTVEYTPFDIKIGELENQAISLFNDSTIQSIFLSLDEKLPLQALNSELSNIGKIRKFRKFNTITSSTSLAMAVVCFILVMGSLIGIIYAYQVCKKHHSLPNDVETPAIALASTDRIQYATVSETNPFADTSV